MGRPPKKLPLYRNVTGVTFIYIRKCEFCNEKVKIFGGFLSKKEDAVKRPQRYIN